LPTHSKHIEVGSPLRSVWAMGAILL